MIEEIKDGANQQDNVRVSHLNKGFELMPNLFNGIKSKLSQSTMQYELEQMMNDPNANVDAKLMRMDALYEDKFSKMQRIIDTKLDKRDFAYFEAVFGKETTKFNGFIDSEKHDKHEFNEKIHNMEDHVSFTATTFKLYIQYKKITEVAANLVEDMQAQVQNLILNMGATNPAGAAGILTTKALVPMNNLAGTLQFTNNKQGGNQSPFEKGMVEDKIAWNKGFTKDNNNRVSINKKKLKPERISEAHQNNNQQGASPNRAPTPPLVDPNRFKRRDSMDDQVIANLKMQAKNAMNAINEENNTRILGGN